MLINKDVAVSTSKVLLVPYEKKHVLKYHQWMQDADLQEATASEPLTIDQEFEMQRSWRQDKDKLTFISCLPIGNSQVPLTTLDDQEQMLGDVNLFLYGPSDTGDEPIVGELEVMVAEKACQRKGYGKASLLAFLTYIAHNEQRILAEYLDRKLSAGDHASIKYLRVKIRLGNIKSRALFQDLGFRELGGGPNYFGEVELRTQKSIREIVSKYLKDSAIADYQEHPYSRKDSL